MSITRSYCAEDWSQFVARWNGVETGVHKQVLFARFITIFITCIIRKISSKTKHSKSMTYSLLILDRTLD